MIDQAGAILRRKSTCGVAGSTDPVGRCWFWWESCPAKVRNCDLRRRNAEVVR